MATLRLILMRHGEAEDGRGMQDHARRLTAGGTAEVRRVVKALVAAQFVPTKAVSSDSTRTKDTAVCVNLELPVALDWQFLPDLYLCGLDKIQAVLERLDARKHQTVLLVGHNPGFSAAGTVLTGDNVSLATAAAALMTVDAQSWKEAVQLTGAWTLDRIITP